MVKDTAGNVVDPATLGGTSFVWYIKQGTNKKDIRIGNNVNSLPIPNIFVPTPPHAPTNPPAKLGVALVDKQAQPKATLHEIDIVLTLGGSPTITKELVPFMGRRERLRIWVRTINDIPVMSQIGGRRYIKIKHDEQPITANGIVESYEDPAKPKWYKWALYDINGKDLLEQKEKYVWRRIEQGYSASLKLKSKLKSGAYKLFLIGSDNVRDENSYVVDSVEVQILPPTEEAEKAKLPEETKTALETGKKVERGAPPTSPKTPQGGLVPSTPHSIPSPVEPPFTILPGETNFSELRVGDFLDGKRITRIEKNEVSGTLEIYTETSYGEQLKAGGAHLNEQIKNWMFGIGLGQVIRSNQSPPTAQSQPNTLRSKEEELAALIKGLHQTPVGDKVSRKLKRKLGF